MAQSLSSHYPAVYINATHWDKQVSKKACCNVRPKNCNCL